jgi:hypothetical protein
MHFLMITSCQRSERDMESEGKGDSHFCSAIQRGGAGSQVTVT